ncbi:MAG TPA: DAK2 domain-containing protein [Erwinia persicina]|uniref:dihydroxyacetone kinase subunit DhaK n=1 Tax=Erwinia persicina TaxID=55211 RepID=UPI0007874C5D|nr:dihydroxyacetone kinase subunit DhaK [Erwinia persicina]MCQ4104546.1 dihydroxyacetone kinase subunit DhaK [Erwinia persicina]UTX12594.1 dihydroxyacetone kinase subunit DhaK [Erwinia persicina]HBQ81222.1 DAK2 domain-containing protein [Erwinia persicina]
MSQFFMNQKQHVVNDAIEGILLSSPHHNLGRLSLGPQMRVVVRKDWDKSRVALISGGGSGHEPAHIGFVGQGMLTAAVCGDIFASPSVDAVLHAIINVTGDAGCLLIVKNYTGDRLNFGLAAEKARGLGYKVEMVMVRDDIALPENPQPRGIAGTALVHKVAGYAAEQGQTLAQVAAVAQQACDATSSIGLAFTTCHVPGETRDDHRVPEGGSELGMGIHGEPGASTLKTQNSAEIVAELVSRLTAKKIAGPLALMVNNLGGFSALEMAVVVREALHSALGQQVKLLIGPATLVSALDMKGFSLSVMQLDAERETALLAPVQVSGWSPAFAPFSAAEIPAKTAAQLQSVTPSDNPTAAAIVKTICQTLIGLESELNQLDAKVGDGDTGSTFAAGARSVLDASEAHALPLNQPHALLTVVGEKLATVMGGSSGVLMSIMFTAAGQQLAAGASLAEALNAGLARMQHYGGAQVGDRTMIDALHPAFAALLNGDDLTRVAAAAREGADSTSTMRSARAGRSSYLNQESLDGVKDPGACAVEKVFAALAVAHQP